MKNINIKIEGVYKKDDLGLWRFPKTYGDNTHYDMPLFYDQIIDKEFQVRVPSLNEEHRIFIPFGPKVKAGHTKEILTYTKCGQCLGDFMYVFEAPHGKEEKVYGIATTYKASKSKQRKRIRLWFRDGQKLETGSGQGGSKSYNTKKANQAIWLNVELDKSLKAAIVFE